MELSVIIPVFNEEAALPALRARLCPVLNTCTSDYEIIFSNDGSTDTTPSLIKAWAMEDKRVKMISLSRRFGKEAAMLAGLTASTGQVWIMQREMPLF